MANCGKDILLSREGSEQLNRFIQALDPTSVKLNDFGLEEWMKFAFNFAGHMNYFDTSDSETANGNWQDFFKADNQLETFLTSLEKEGNIPPHLALFVSFVQLLEFSKNRFNNLTKRHLDFYYKQILQIEKLPATPDKVHIIFELAKNSVSEKIDSYTELNGGKDSNGNKLIYKTSEKLVANQTKVAQLKSVYNSHSHKKIKAANTTNSFDGNDGEFIDSNLSWWPFGYLNDKTHPDLNDAKLGFALSSEILELQEGLRTVSINIQFQSPLAKVEKQATKNYIQVYCSGEKEWIGPLNVSIENISTSKNKLLKNTLIESSFKTKGVRSFGIGSLKSDAFYNVDALTITFEIPKDYAPVVAYNSEMLGENFETELPVCRLLFNTGNTKAFDFYRELIGKEIKSLSVQVDVEDAKSLLLESDMAALKASKPFYPFGTQPLKNSKFYINYPEVFKKSWQNFEVIIEWKNTPNDFKEWYFAYRKKHLTQVSASSFVSGIGDYIKAKNITAKITGKENILSNPLSQFQPNTNDLIVKNSDYFKATVEINHKEEWEKVDAYKNFALFNEKNNVFSTSFKINNNNQQYETDKNGPVRLSLDQSFLHELFPRIYALAMSSEEKDVLIPNEPYTPFVESISLNYSAKSVATFESEAFQNNDIKLFHEHPFGQAEQHLHLKSQAAFLTDNKIYLVPTYCQGGELYIGLENAKTRQNVSLLVQVLEGSENPETDSFTGKQKVKWSVLCQNEWKTLDSNDLISNETDNFLKSGIIKFTIPKEATLTNTLLPEKYIWLKAKIHKTFDAVCKTLDIQAQTVLAEFTDNQNELSHLEKGLEAETISKMIKRLPKIKGLSQPFNSFGGKPEESDEEYYRRISERLRHKNRAITIWDYEHIILQNFPEIHKVKCLNHTNETSFLAPGNVLIIVIPDIVDKNVFDIYQPRVSQATLNEIQNLINGLNSLHVKEKVVNPEYEEVKVEVLVRFHQGFDENYYKNVLKEDITKLLSPWAFDNSANISFGQSLHQSILINYLENLGYVDYVENVSLQHKHIGDSDFKQVKVAIPSSPKAILVSAKNHVVDTDITACNTQIEVPETCQK